MALSSDLISQFVKVTNDNKKTVEETTVYGTIVEYEGIPYVRLDGSELLTPITTTTVVKPGERVAVMIKNHTATVTGNVTSPSAQDKDVADVLNKTKDAMDKISEFEIVVAYRVKTDELEAINATINKLQAKVAKISSLSAVEADIEKLRAEYAKLDYVQAKEVEALNAQIENIQAKFGDFADISTEELEAMNADINQLKAYNADFTYVSADVLKALKASINKLDVENFDAKYADIDFSNIGKAAIEQFFSKSGLIENVVVGEETVTGILVGVTIKGDLIEGGTVVADKLVIQGEDGLYYKLNTDGVTTEAEQTDYNSLNGSIITAKSITATKIAVDDLVAFGATIGGFHITNNAIYSGVKSAVGNTTRGSYMDSDGQIAFGDGNNFIKYYQDTDGNYKLALSAASIVFAASKTDVETAISDAHAAANAAQESANKNANDMANVIDDNEIAQATAEAAQETAKNAETLIQQLSDSISMLVTDGNGTSLMTQTEDGWTFSTAEIQASVNDISENLNNLTDDLGSTSSAVNVLKQAVADLGEIAEYVKIGTYENEPCIELGESDSEFKMRITNTRILFMEGSNVVAHISNQSLHIKKAVIEDELQQGDFIWQIRSNGNLGLIWKG
jgi:hypothetical protein